MSYYPYYAHPPGPVHPLHAVSIHPNHTQSMYPAVTQQAPNLRPDAHQAGTSASDAFVRVLGERIDRTLAATQALLNKRLSAQDAQLARQQETLDSISRSLSAVRGEVTEIHDTVKIGTYDNDDRIEKLAKAIGDSFKKLCDRTREEFRGIEVKNGKMWGVIEESLEALREEVKDPHADCNPTIPPVVYRDASVAPTPSHVLPVSASHVETDMAQCGTDDVYDQETERNNPAERDHSSPGAIVVDIGEDCEVSYSPMLNAPVTINPLETLHDPTLHVPLSPLDHMSESSSTTSTLPDPRSLLNTFESKSPKEKSKPRAESLLSLSSLSTLSDYAAPASMSTETSPFKVKSSPNRLGKRRRSSPSPTRGKSDKKARAGNARAMKREMIDAASPMKLSKAKPKCSWPEKVSKTKESIQLIECNKCKNWYHWGCTGIRKNDSRLETGKEFVCPPCKFKVEPDTAGRTNDRGICARPDCEINENSDEVYVIERLIGRYEGGNRSGRNFSWLIKWDGYPANQSTWTPQSDIADAASLIESFEKAARTERLQMQGRSLLLLKEAVQAGWQNTRKV